MLTSPLLFSLSLFPSEKFWIFTICLEKYNKTFEKLIHISNQFWLVKKNYSIKIVCIINIQLQKVKILWSIILILQYLYFMEYKNTSLKSSIVLCTLIALLKIMLSNHYLKKTLDFRKDFKVNVLYIPFQMLRKIFLTYKVYMIPYPKVG